MKSWQVRLIGWTAGLLIAAEAQAVSIAFDYSYDTQDFFDTNPQAVTGLGAAAEVFNAFFDDLEAIQPTGFNSWKARFIHPGTGNVKSVNNMVVPADTLIVFVGGRDLPENVIGEAGPGGWSAKGTSEWLETVQYRGQTGASLPQATDFGPWGGSMTFDTDTDWHLGVDTYPQSGQVDFLSVAVHELAHVLGFGISDSWYTCVTGSQFTGAVSTTIFGGSVPLSSELAHWASGTMSTAGGLPQEAAMSPSIVIGTRKLFTVLDYAGMIDVGWEFPPTGDATADGAVDGADYTIWADNYETAGLPGASEGGWFFGNFNEDDVVDGGDYTLWADNYNPPGGGIANPAAFGSGGLEAAIDPSSMIAGAAATVVPEPGGLALLAAGALLGLRRRRR